MKNVVLCAIYLYLCSGSLKLDICVAGDSIKHCLTPELAKLKPYPGIIIITVIINY